MKAITLYEPYASLMAIGAKVNETRPMRTSHRGDICIHAAKTDTCWISSEKYRTNQAFEQRGLDFKPAFGCIVAVVELWDVQPSEKFYVEPPTSDPFCISEEEFNFGNYAPGRFIYRTRNLRRLATPVPARGFQSIGWTVPPDIDARVDAEIRIWMNRCLKNEICLKGMDAFTHCNCEGCIQERRED